MAILEQHLEVATGRIDYAEARQWREYLEDHRAELGFTQARIVAELEQLTGAVGNAWVNSDSGSPASGDSASMPESWQSEGNEAQSQSVREIVAQAIPDDTETWDVVSVSNSDTIRAQRRARRGGSGSLTLLSQKVISRWGQSPSNGYSR